jgi:hypothetical protein
MEGKKGRKKEPIGSLGKVKENLTDQSGRIPAEQLSSVRIMKSVVYCSALHKARNLVLLEQVII